MSLTPQEEQEIRSKSSYDLAKRNNVLVNGALVYETEEKKLKIEAEFQVIREELTARGILSSSGEVRLISGSELV